MVIVNPSLSVDELNTRKLILQSCKEDSYLVKPMESLILWKDYYALDICLTECNYASNVNATYQPNNLLNTFWFFLSRYKNNILQLNADVPPSTKVPYTLHKYIFHNDAHHSFSVPVATIYVKLHESRQHHLTHGSYVAWSTLLDVNHY